MRMQIIKFIQIEIVKVCVSSGERLGLVLHMKSILTQQSLFTKMMAFPYQWDPHLDKESYLACLDNDTQHEVPPNNMAPTTIRLLSYRGCQ